MRGRVICWDEEGCPDLEQVRFALDDEAVREARAMVADEQEEL